jgi:hypothetical protein
VLKGVALVLPMPYWAMLVPAFLLTLAGTAVLHYAVERPFSLRPPKPPAAVPTARQRELAASRAA